MPRLKLRLSTLMATVVLIALMLGSLRYATEAWSGVVLLGTLAVLGYAVVSAVYRKGAAGAFWLGFAVFGGGYAGLIAVISWAKGDLPPGHDLPTTRAIDKFGPYLAPEPVVLGGLGGPFASGGWTPLIRNPEAVNRPTWAGAWSRKSRSPSNRETSLQEVRRVPPEVDRQPDPCRTACGSSTTLEGLPGSGEDGGIPDQISSSEGRASM